MYLLSAACRDSAKEDAGGLDTLLAETSSARQPLGNLRACAGLVELLTSGTLSRTKGRGRLASSRVEGVWLGLSGVP